MHGDARGLARRVEAGELGKAVVVRVDAAHVVVGAGPDGDRVVDRSTPAYVIASSREPGSRSMIRSAPRWRRSRIDRAVHPAALLDLGRLRARDDVARGELHRVRRVVLHEALAVLVDQEPALAAAALGDEDPGREQRRRVELHELHVLQREPGAEGHRHPVAGARVRVRGRPVEATRAARREDDGLAADRPQAAVEQVPADDALAAIVVHDEAPCEELLVNLDVRAGRAARREPGSGRGR